MPSRARPTRCSALARETGCRPLALDISHRDAVLSALGGLDADVLVNNASPLVRSTASWEAAPDDIDALVEVNIKGALNCLAATVPGMKARGLGHIVNLGSMAGRLADPRHAGLRHDQGGHSAASARRCGSTCTAAACG